MVGKILMALADGVAALAMPHGQFSFIGRWCHWSSSGRNCMSEAGCPFSRSFWCVCVRDHDSRRDVLLGSIADRKMTREELWRNFFSDPAQWWDHRVEKGNVKFPDFKHKRTGQSLWLNNSFTPKWVEAELVRMAPGLLQSHNFSWNVRLRRHLKAEDYAKILNLFRQMQKEGMIPDKFTFVAVLNACTNLRALEEGRRVHENIIQRGCDSEIYVTNCLVDMYAKCGSTEDAWNVFNKMRQRDVVSWNAMIGGYVKSAEALKALELFQKMQQEGVEPDAVTFVGALSACASVAAFEQGRRVHEQITQRGCAFNIYIATCLVDMYSRCGSIAHARGVFNTMRERDVVSWNAMIGGYAMHGHSKEVIGFFKRMDKEGVEIDEITFTCLLSACSHDGLLKEGLLYFKTMTPHYNVLPTREHYACIVDLLGRAGRLEEAEEMTKSMPMERDCCVWRSLLGACRIHANVEMAERAAKKCWELDPEDASAHVLLSNIYAAAGKWDRSAAIDKEILRKKAWKEPGRTWIEVNNMVNSFIIDDMEHPQILQIRAALERLSVQMNEASYIPDSRFLLHEEMEECHLCCPGEMLPIAYEAYCTLPGTAPLIKKHSWSVLNARVP